MSITNNIRVSFEFFPPKTEKMEGILWESIQRLAPLSPDFVSVTYGAGGSTRERTHATIRRILSETALRPAAHLTCVDATRDEINRVAGQYWEDGVRHIVALRGDVQDGGKEYRPAPGGYAYAVDLVKGLRDLHEFEISVAAYPETHPEAPSQDFDIENLKKKIDAGATRAITQFFFYRDVFLRFRDRCERAGIHVPIAPGILPVTNFRRTQEFAAQCGATVPEWMVREFEGLDDDPDTRKLISATVAIRQVRELQAEGVRDFHFYTLNRADLTYAICHALGFRSPVIPSPHG